MTAAPPRTVLGIETSCDETSAAVLAAGPGGARLASCVILSQDVHRIYRGVVPELASRAHLVAVGDVVDRALSDAGATLGDVDLLAVTEGPGLVGALLVGVTYAKGLACAAGTPLVGVHHLEGHLFGTALEDADAEPPFVALLVSGGHSMLLDVSAWGRYRLLGETRDDAVGEAFDKVAKLLGLPYPGGPALAKLAEAGNPAVFAFPRPMQSEPGLDFSFSGLKTAVALAAQKHPDRGADLAASFEAAATDVLVAKARRAARDEGLVRVAVVGGVAANARLRREFAAAAARDGFALFLPPLALCTDNAAMIAAAGAGLLARGLTDSLALSAFSRVALPDRPWSEAKP